MTDVFSEVDFLLFSPSLTQTLAEQHVELCFLLTGFNGECWQTYGPLVAFSSFDSDDVFYFATAQNRDIYNEIDLINGSTFPAIVQQGYEVVYLSGNESVPFLDINASKAFFKVAYAPPVFKLTTAEIDKAPHFAAAYYHEEKGLLTLEAMTDKGYRQLQELLVKAGMKIGEEPDFRIHLPMIKLIKDILGKTVPFTPYEKMFEKKSDSIDDGTLARQSGVDPKTVQEILGISMKKINEMKKKRYQKQ